MQKHNLSHSYEIVLKPTAPFNFDATFFKPDHFTPYDFEFQHGKRRTTANFAGNKVGLVFKDFGRINEPQVLVEIYSTVELEKESLDYIESELRYRYNLDLNLEDFYKRLSENIHLKTPIHNLFGMRPGHPNSLYEYIMIGIMLQNASIKRSLQMYQRMLQNYGEEINFDGVRMNAFWNIGDLEAVEEQDLRDLKVGYRAKSFKRVDQYFKNGLINEIELRRGNNPDLQKSELLKIYGVGHATVWYLMFDIFHRWEVFEHISQWEQKLYSKLFFDRDLNDLVPVNEILSFIDQFGEYKHLAVHYLWEDLWWRRQNGEEFEWLEKEIRK